MATSIIQIDVQDEAFKEFQTLFEKYREQVAGMPDAWKKVSSASEGAATAGATGGKRTQDAWAKVDASIAKSSNPFTRIGAAAAGTVDQVRKAQTVQDKFRAAATGTGKTFGAMAQSTKSIAGNIKNATMQLLRWASLTSVFAGLAGAGGLFGIARLAESASSTRRESQGLGVTPGELQSTRLNYSKLIDVDAVLSRINEARQDVTKRWAFSAAGLPAGQIEGKSNAEVLRLLLPLLKSTNERAGGTTQGAQAHGLLEFTDMPTLTRLRAVQQSEISAATAAFDRDRQALAMADKTLAVWQQLDMQLRRAGTSIENLFIVKLAALTGPIAQLSEAFARAVKTLLDSPKIEKWIGQLGHGLENLARYLSGDEFQHDVNGVLDALDTFAGAVYTAARTLGKVLNFGSERTLRGSDYRRLDALEKIAPDLAKRERERLENPTQTREMAGAHFIVPGRDKGVTKAQLDIELLAEAYRGPRGKDVERLITELRNAEVLRDNDGRLIAPIKLDKPPAPRKTDAAPTFYGQLERDHGLPPGLLAAVEHKESGGRAAAVGPRTSSGERARGAFQFMGETARQYGVKDPFNKPDAARGAAEMFGGLSKKYRGDLPRMLAAYNWGQGNLDRLGEAKEPAETRDYVQTIMAQMTAPPVTVSEQMKEAAPALRAASTVTTTTNHVNASQAATSARAPVTRMPAIPATVVTISNNTGGNAVVIANQVAQ